MTDNEKFKSGFISIIGRPNVGKSTLLNVLLGEKIAIVSSKPQTTRNRILGIVNQPGAQFVFLDTPGIHKPMHKMNEVMVKTALQTYNEVDVILMLVEAQEQPGGGDRFIVETLSAVKTPVFLLINKVDLIKKEALLPLMQEYSTTLQVCRDHPRVSAQERPWRSCRDDPETFAPGPEVLSRRPADGPA